MRIARLVTAVVGWSVATVACSSAAPDSPTDAGAPSAADASYGCSNDTRAQTYTANLQQQGMSGALTFVLMSASPAPPAENNNTWTLKILDKTGTPVTNATFPPLSTWGGWPIGVRPFMPDHGHASSAFPAVMPNADGTYTITPLYFFMPGIWQITINAQSGSTTDSAVYTFCVNG